MQILHRATARASAFTPKYLTRRHRGTEEEVIRKPDVSFLSLFITKVALDGQGRSVMKIYYN
jgi:hypothetical protein